MTIKEFRIFIVYLTITGFIILGFYLEKTSSESITDKVQAICSFLSLGVSLVAIIYVYKTYKAQKDDTEFNRIVDMIYRQMEFAERKVIAARAIKPSSEEEIRIKDFNNNMTLDNLVPTLNFLLNIYLPFTKQVKLMQDQILNAKITNQRKYELLDIVSGSLLSEHLDYVKMLNRLCEPKDIGKLLADYEFTIERDFIKAQLDMLKDALKIMLDFEDWKSKLFIMTINEEE